MLTRHTIVQDFIAITMEPLFGQDFSKHAHFGTLLIKRRAITEAAHHGACLSCHSFHQLSNSHTTGNGVWINNDVGTQSLGRKRHISFGNNHTHCALLSRTRCHFVADFGNALLHNTDFGNAFSLLIVGHKGLIDHPQLPFFREFGLIHIGAFCDEARCGRGYGGQSNQGGFVID